MMKKKRRVTHEYFEFAYRQYMPLIRKLAFRIGTNKTQVEEMKVRAFTELLKCMICYNRSASFMTYFYGRLVGVFRHMRDEENRAKRQRTILTDPMTNISGPDYDMDSHMMVEECLECLDEEERDIISDIYFSSRTMREISDCRGIVASGICRIKAKAIDKMKKRHCIELE